MTPAPGACLTERYQLLRRIARGGMGEIWVARHLELGCEVAAKLIVEELVEPTALARFQREARAAASLSSSHVVRLFDYGRVGTRPYLVMELLSGETLGERLSRVGALPVPRIVRILEEICRGLEVAHSRGILHRDLKPSNIFLAREGATEVVKLIDFGLAVRAAEPSSQLTDSGLIVGTVSYMSPEQARGGVLDVRSDLWSVAVVTYEMLTGRRLFDSAHSGDCLVKVCSEPIAPVSAHQPAFAVFDEFFAQALARDVESRYPSATAFFEAFRSLTDSVPTTDQGVSSVVQHGAISPDATASRIALPRDEATVSLAGATTGNRDDASIDVARPRSPVRWGIASAVVLVVVITTLRSMESSRSAVDAFAAPAEVPRSMSPGSVASPGLKVSPGTLGVRAPPAIPTDSVSSVALSSTPVSLEARGSLERRPAPTASANVLTRSQPPMNSEPAQRSKRRSLSKPGPRSTKSSEIASERRTPDNSLLAPEKTDPGQALDPLFGIPRATDDAP